MSGYIANKEPMDYFLVDSPTSVGIEDHSYRSERNEWAFGLWYVKTGIPKGMLFVTRRTYPNAILCNSESEANKAIKDPELYQKYLDLQPPGFGEQDFYSYWASSDGSTDLIQAHIPQDLATKFKILCAQKRIKQREALATIIAEWIKANE